MRSGTVRRFAAAALVVFGALLTGCQCSHEYDAGTATKEATCKEEGIRIFTCQKCGESYEEPIPLTEHTYSDKVSKEPTYEEEGTRTFSCSTCRDSYTQPIPVLEKPVEVAVTAKRTQTSYFFDWVELDFSVENTGDTDIRGFRGNLVIRDIFGKELVSRQCRFVEPFPAGETVEVTEISMLIDPYDEMEKKLYDTSFKDLQFFYELRQVIFTGEEEAEKIALDGPVTIRVSTLYSVPSNIEKGKIISSIQVSLHMFNHTDKKIKGVDGSLVFLDLFGEELMVKDCPLLRDKGHDENKEQIYNIHYEVNDFSNEANVLYAEFQDLNFEYRLSSILFEDGTQEFFEKQEGTVEL